MRNPIVNDPMLVDIVKRTGIPKSSLVRIAVHILDKKTDDQLWVLYRQERTNNPTTPGRPLQKNQPQKK